VMEVKMMLTDVVHAGTYRLIQLQKKNILYIFIYVCIYCILPLFVTINHLCLLLLSYLVMHILAAHFLPTSGRKTWHTM